MAVADAYDSMTSARPYQPGMPIERALQVLREGAGTQWDADVVGALLGMAESGELSRVLTREEESLALPTHLHPHLPQTALKAA